MDTEKIALFPIPEMVSFPYTVVPLHVFEPRYRSMIKDCVKNKIKIGVCHIEDIISQAPKNQSPENILNSNLSTFKPQSIFSAGHCVIDDVTADGRFRVHIDMDARYRIEKIIQEIPYVTCLCEEYKDDETDEKEDFASSLRTRIDSFLKDYALKSDDKAFVEFLESNNWTDMSDLIYSFRIFEKIRLQGNLAQEALEKKTPSERLNVIDKTLKLSDNLS